MLCDRINNQLQVIALESLSPESRAAIREIGRLVGTLSLETTEAWVTEYLKATD